MRSLLAGPSLLRHWSNRGYRTAGLCTSAALAGPRPTSSRRAAVAQPPKVVTPSTPPPILSSVSQVLSPDVKDVPKVTPALVLGPSRRERRKVEREAKKKAVKRRREAKSAFVKAGLTERVSTPFVRIDGQFKTFKPITPSLRWVRHTVQEHLWKGRPLNILTVAKRGTGGRNHHGHITVRGRGGGHRRRLRMVDFYRWESGAQEVLRIEYDPGRSAHIALVEHTETKVKSYILASEGLREGDTVQSYRLDKAAISQATGADGGTSLDMGIFRTRAIRPGNVLPLRLIPVGTTIHAVSLDPKGPAKLVRSAGAYGQVVAFVYKKEQVRSAAKAEEAAKANPATMAMPGSLPGSDTGAQGTSADATDPFMIDEDDYSSSAATGTQTGAQSTHAQVKLQSGEVRLVRSDCCATIGRVSNADHHHERLGKAGRARWMGRRPKVRGVAMNAVDHPHGGGRGKSKSNKHPRSIYGHLAKGPRTRKPGTRGGNRMVVKERPRGKDKRR